MRSLGLYRDWRSHLNISLGPGHFVTGILFFIYFLIFLIIYIFIYFYLLLYVIMMSSLDSNRLVRKGPDPQCPRVLTRSRFTRQLCKPLWSRSTPDPRPPLLLISQGHDLDPGLNIDPRALAHYRTYVIHSRSWPWPQTKYRPTCFG